MYLGFASDLAATELNMPETRSLSSSYVLYGYIQVRVQCPFDIPTLNKAAAMPIAAATCVTDLRQYINSNLAYSGLKFFVLCTNKRTRFFGIAPLNCGSIEILNIFNKRNILRQILLMKT